MDTEQLVTAAAILGLLFLALLFIISGGWIPADTGPSDATPSANGTETTQATQAPSTATLNGTPTETSTTTTAVANTTDTQNETCPEA